MSAANFFLKRKPVISNYASISWSIGYTLCVSVTDSDRLYANYPATRRQRRVLLQVAHKFPPGSIASPKKGPFAGSYCRVVRVCYGAVLGAVWITLQEPVSGEAFSCPSAEVRLRSRAGVKLTPRGRIRPAKGVLRAYPLSMMDDHEFVNDYGSASLPFLRGDILYSH